MESVFQDMHGLPCGIEMFGTWANFILKFSLLEASCKIGTIQKISMASAE
eukprot:Gb_10469 [translate_table: standard]